MHGTLNDAAPAMLHVNPDAVPAALVDAWDDRYGERITADEVVADALLDDAGVVVVLTDLLSTHRAVWGGPIVNATETRDPAGRLQGWIVTVAVTSTITVAERMDTGDVAGILNDTSLTGVEVARGIIETIAHYASRACVGLTALLAAAEANPRP